MMLDADEMCIMWCLMRSDSWSKRRVDRWEVLAVWTLISAVVWKQ